MTISGLDSDDVRVLGDLFSEGPVVVFKWSNQPGWPVEYVSSNVGEIYGHTSRELVGGTLKYADLIHPDDLKRVAVEVAKASASGQAIFNITPYRIVRPNGEIRWIEERTHVVRDSDGIITHFIGYVIDITDRRQTEEARRDSEARYRTMVNATPQGFWLVDDDDVTLEVNPAMCRMIGYEADELVGTKPFDYLTEESQEILRQQMGIRAPGDQRTYELTLKTKKGEHKRVLLHATTLPDTIKKGRSFAFITDLTNILETQQTLSILWHALEQSPVGIIITDEKGVMSYVNPYFTTMTGYTADEALGKNTSILKSGRTDPNVYEDLWETVSAGDVWRGDLVNARKSGELYWERQTIAPITDESGTIRHYVAFKEDVTAYKAAMEEQVRAKEEAELANQAKSAFLANMSHELRTPLNAIIGFSEMMNAQIQGELPEVYRDYATLIHDSGTHLLGIINNILDMTRVEANRINLSESDVLLDNLVFECITLLEEKARLAEVQVTNTVAPNCRLRVDPLRLKQVLLNLISNGIKFSLGGTVTITTSRRFGRFAISVMDTGRGMSSDEIALALKPFGQSRPDAYLSSGDGLGLGLPISKRLIEAHGGSLEIESAPGRGTSVHILLPAERVINDGMS